MIDFSGWEMPLQYQGILSEHLAVRNHVGLFDVSHMGRIKVSGEDAERLLDYVSTNRITGKNNGSATYTVWSYAHGGSVDDVIIYKIDDSHFFVIVNASNRDKDLIHLTTQANELKCDVKIEERYSGTGIIALQGPAALPLISLIYPIAESLKPMHFVALDSAKEFYLSRTGYTGAGGFEIYGSDDEIVALWDRLIEEGKEFHLQPAGLGARDTLRLEMGFALYGHELSDIISPNESVSAWTVKWDKPTFLGKESLEILEHTKRLAFGVKLEDRGVPRQGCQVLKSGEAIGVVTSGSFSPILNQGIALILVQEPLVLGEKVEIQIRNALCSAIVVELPFVRKTG